MRHRRSFIVGSVLAPLVLLGCGSDDSASTSTTAASTSTTSTEASTTTVAQSGATSTTVPESGAAGDALPAGRNVVFVRAVDLVGRTVTVDLAEFLTGDAAIAKAKAAGDLDESCNCVPNDYYISNVNPKLRTVAVPVSAAISVLDRRGRPSRCRRILRGCSSTSPTTATRRRRSGSRSCRAPSPRSSPSICPDPRFRLGPQAPSRTRSARAQRRSAASFGRLG